MKKIVFLKKMLPLLGMMLLGVALSAQTTVSGIVTDDSGEPLIGANVIVRGTADGTVTDFDGRFSFNTSQSYPLTLSVSFTGFTSQEIDVAGPQDVTITLSEGVVLGEDVVISASRKREKVQEAPASVSVLGTKALESSANPVDPTRNLVNTAGVQIQQQSANRINISMRGSAGLFGSSVFPIMDYRSLVGPGIGTFQSEQAGIMNLDLARIEVVRGPGSALYGPGVTQGVVHFLTKSPIDYPGTSVEGILGELSTYGGALRHATKVSDKFGFKINAQYREGNEFEYDPNDPDDAAYLRTFLPDQGQGRGVYFPSVSGGVVNETPGSGTLLLPLSELDKDNNGNPMQSDWYSLGLNTTLEFRPSDDVNVNLSGGYNSASSYFFNEQGPGLANANEFWGQARLQAGNFFGQIFYLDNDGGQGDNATFLYKTGNRTSIARTQLEAQGQYNLNTPSFLDADWTVGFDYRFSSQDTENLTYGSNELDDDFSIIGGYLQSKIPLGDKLDMVLAARYDQFNFIDQGAFSPRAAFVYKASPKHTFRTAYNRTNSTVTNLQLNIDFPLVTVIPGSFGAWLYGNKTTQTFADNPTYKWFTGLLPEVPVAAPGAGLPLGAITQFPVAPGTTLNQAIIGQLVQALSANPATASAVPIVQQVLGNLDPTTLGFGGQLSDGFNIFDGTPLGLQDAPISAISTADNFEIGYKGLFADKFSVALDVYYIREDRNSQFTAISPAYKLLGIDGIAGDLGTAVQNMAQPQIQAALEGAGLPPQVAAATAAALGGAINQAYTAGGNNFLNTPSAAFGGATLTQVLNQLPFHATTETQQTPQNGVTHLALGYRTFGPRDYWGSDLGLEYYVSNDFTLFGNYSWVSDNEFMQNVIGAPEGAPALPTSLNIPKNKFRLGMRYTPDFGVRAQLGFQHDDAFNTNAGDFSGVAEEKNLVDASLGYKFNNGLTLDVSATNLFNNEYRYYPNMPVIGRRVLGKVTYDFGGSAPDADGDGVRDSKDACPMIAGLKQFNGCPDSDGDGVIDSEDMCPMTAGSAADGGCPDADGDGVIDKDDKCPSVAGTLMGCPDSDGDGVADKDDNCPNAAGTLGGCPDADADGVKDADDACPNTAGSLRGCPDSDGDGVADKDDECPNVKGDAANGCKTDSDGDGVADDSDPCPNVAGDMGGCPDSDGDGIADNKDKCPNEGGNVGPDGCKKAVPAAATTVFAQVMEEVHFQSGRAVLTRKSLGVLDQVADIMAQHPALMISVGGHTDSQGRDDRNMTLSAKRAQAVVDYLVKKGVDATRMTSTGYGETSPRADNNTAAGRKKNRRVEIIGKY